MAEQQDQESSDQADRQHHDPHPELHDPIVHRLVSRYDNPLRLKSKLKMD